jgi:hypothetical protein
VISESEIAEIEEKTAENGEINENNVENKEEFKDIDN